MTATTFAPLAPTLNVPPAKIADDTWLIHSVQPACGEPLHVYLNSLLILGAEPMIVDTGTIANREQWMNDVFSLVEPKMGSADGGTVTGCKNLTMFVNNVKPLLASGTCSTQCHVGASPTANLKWDTTPDAALCQVALTEINTTTPAQSQLLLQPDPAQGGNGHPVKVNPFTNFQTAVTNWINAEK